MKFVTRADRLVARLVFRLLSRCGAVLLAGTVAAQSGPGLPNLAFTPAELFHAVATIGSGHHGKPMMHDGFLTVVETDPNVAVRFYDISNPYLPVLVNTITGAGLDLPEQHTSGQTTAFGGGHVILTRGFGPLAGGGGSGIAIWDWSDVHNPQLRSSFDLPGVPGGYSTGMFWMAVQAPYIYCPTGSLGLFIVDASDPTNPFVANHIPTSQLGGFNTVLAFTVGNMLIVTNNDSGTGVGPGFARLDIGDPIHPQLVYSTTNTSSAYGASVNGGRLVVPGVDGTFRLHDLYTPTFPQINEFPIGGTRGASAVVQDDFVHVGSSTVYYKMDVSDPNAFTVVGAFSSLEFFRDEDWVTPIGNLVAVADDAGVGTHLVPHQANPDSLGPSVNMVDPVDGATNQALTSRIGITMTDMVELNSIDQQTFTVRPIGGKPLAGVYSHQFGVVNFAPDQPLIASTTYEIVIPAGGMRDWAGNPVPTDFISRFSTGPQVTAIDVVARAGVPTPLGQATAVDVASAIGPGPFLYSWNFGDGSPSTPFSTSSQATHNYAAAGHYSVLVVANNGQVTTADSFVQTVHHPLTTDRPSHSSTIAIDESLGRVWCVNADNDSVTAVDQTTLAKVLEIPVGTHPRTLAAAPDGSIWVVCQDDASIHVLDPVLGLRLAVIPLPHASAPYGIAMSPDHTASYVTLRATGRIAKVNVRTRRYIGQVAVGPDPKGLAITADSRRIFVTRFRSAQVLAHSGAASRTVPGATVYELPAAALHRKREIPLAIDPGPDTEASGRGLPNYLSSLTISPDGRRLWIPSKKDNITRGLFRDGQPLTFESTVRTIVSQVDLGTGQEDRASRIDLNNRDMAFAVELSPLGDYAFFAVQGSNTVMVVDAYTGALVASVDGTGLAPQGLALTRDGSTLFVHNFTSRTIAVFNARGVTDSTNFAMPELARVSTVANERLAPQVLRGKQIFYNATDPRINQDGYISCASCHLDGGDDGRVWDFSDRGEGLRNTVSLLGRAGIGHGNVHWTANFDEIQDFEHDMRGGFGGDGFLTEAQWATATVSTPLGTPKTGLSPELDALAAYVTSLDSFGLSPYRRTNGALTPRGAAGKVLFANLNCAQCHSGSAFTDSQTGLIHNVGTLTRGSGRTGGASLFGLDTPTLRGLWATAPYLHDGSAATLMDVLTTRNSRGLHGNTASLTALERAELLSYLLQIDDREP